MTNLKQFQLKQLWTIGTRIGSGGFAPVFEGTGPNGENVAIKLIPKEPGAQRELLFESLTGSPNIVPIIDSGEDANYYIIVMPRAERSLRDYLNESGKLDEQAAVAVLSDIATALSSLETSIVHRDLKPENVLFLDGHWCLADFGIARYAEASTSLDTRKFSMTREYAAPEQWRGERATHATDIYGLGIIAYELVQGERPFQGPEFRKQHLEEPPPRLGNVRAALASLISECLQKPPGARPNAQSVLNRLGRVLAPLSAAAGRLQQAYAGIAAGQTEDSARKSAQDQLEEERLLLRMSAYDVLQRILEEMLERIRADAPGFGGLVFTKAGEKHFDRFEVTLGHGQLTVEKPMSTSSESCRALPFDVVASSAIEIKTGKAIHGYMGRKHSLWFGDIQEKGRYQWFELSFMYNPLTMNRSPIEPFPLNPGDASVAFSPVIGSFQLAWNPRPIDQGEEEGFMDRWINWFAAAAEGQLHHPSRMPDDNDGFYRH